MVVVLNNQIYYNGKPLIIIYFSYVFCCQKKSILRGKICESTI